MQRTVEREPVETSPAHSLLQTIADTPEFRRAPALRRLLVYLWDHRLDAPSEYAIGVDVFGKRADFDPKLDATVRVNVSRLRAKLKEVEESNSQGQLIRISIPAGSHRLEVQKFQAPTLPPPAPSPTRPHFVFVGATICLALLMLAVWQYNEARMLRRAAATRESSLVLPAFWKRVLNNGRLTRLVFPSPAFVQVGQLRIRDVTINDPQSQPASVPIRSLLGAAATPTLNQSYSVASDTLAIANLLQLLVHRGIPIAVNGTREVSLELFGRDNIIFLGIPHTSPFVERLLSQTEFSLEGSGMDVVVRRPRPGEALRYSNTSQPGLKTQYGIISILPGQAPGTKLILLCGHNSLALASYLTSPVTLRQLQALLEKNDNPEYFELILACQVDGVNLAKAEVAAFRQASATLWEQRVTAQ